MRVRHSLVSAVFLKKGWSTEIVQAMRYPVGQRIVLINGSLHMWD